MMTTRMTMKKNKNKYAYVYRFMIFVTSSSSLFFFTVYGCFFLFLWRDILIVQAKDLFLSHEYISHNHHHHHHDSYANGDYNDDDVGLLNFDDDNNSSSINGGGDENSIQNQTQSDSSILTTSATSSSVAVASPFCIIVDGGSTGSRLHIYEFIYNSIQNETHCIRRGSKRVNVPLSSMIQYYYQHNNDQHNEHENNIIQIAQHLIPLFEYAAQQIPFEYHTKTLVKIQATAGMRLLSITQQDWIYHHLYQGLIQHSSFVFTSLQRLDIHTLSGNLEGFYGVVAANYLHGNIDPFLNVKQSHSQQEQQQQEQGNGMKEDYHTITTTSLLSSSLVGALDMGGSSTQIVYFSPSSSSSTTTTATTIDSSITKNTSSNTLDDHHTCIIENNSSCIMQDNHNNNKMNPQDFVSTSHLSFGVDQFRQRLYDSWIQDIYRFTRVQNDETEEEENDVNNRLNETIVLYNPCHFQGYTSIYKGYTMIGIGNATTCSAEIKQLIHIAHPSSSSSSSTTTTSSSSSTTTENKRVVDDDDNNDHHYDDDDDDDSEIDNDNENFNSYVKPLIMDELSSSTSTTTLRMVGGVQYPPTLQGKFIAMSLFFFTLDCLRELSSHEPLKETWPTPTIQDLATALDSLCSRQWYGDLEVIQHEAHIYTRAEILPERCFESVYMVTLLRDGYGFHPNSQDITFTYLVGGSEVEWSLGMALSLFAQEHNFLTVTELEDIVEHSDSLLSTWNRSISTTAIKNNTTDEEKNDIEYKNTTSSKLLSQFLSDIIAHLPHWVSAMSYQEIATGKGHFLIL